MNPPPSRRGLLAGGAACAWRPGPARAQDATALAGPGGGSGWLPLELRDGHVRLSALVDGRPARVIVDSGAGASVLEAGFARRLGLRATGASAVMAVGGAAQGAVTGPVRVRLGALTLDLRRAVVLDLSAVRAAGGDFQAVLGRDLFEAVRTEFDWAGRRAAFRLPTAPGAEPPAGVLARLLRPAGQGQRVMEFAVDGRPSASGVFDLGSGSAFMCSRAFADAAGLLEGRRTSTWVSAGVEGVATCTTVTLDGLSLGGVRLRNVPAQVYDRWDTPGAQAAIGLPALSRHHLWTDYARDRLWLDPEPDAGTRPFAKDRSGLACAELADGALRVVHVARWSPAERGGWRVGEVIASVEALPAPGPAGAAREAPPPRLDAAWGEAPAGTRYRLTLAGGDIRHLILLDYF